MKLAELSQQQEQLLQEFKERGGVIDFVVIELDDELGDDYGTHWEAAILALDKQVEDNDDYFQALLKTPEYQHHSRDDFFQITYDVTKLVGDVISLSQFLGPFFNLDSKRLLMGGESKKHINDFFWFGDEEVPENIVGQSGLYGDDTLALADAFLCPPYGINGSPSELNTLFLALTDHFFASFTDAGQICTWSDDFSNYFDAGKEWWGTLFCTYFCRPHSSIVAVLASTTD